MRKIVFILLIVFASCEKPEHVQRLTYGFMPEQTNMIEVDVVPVGDINIDQKEMLEEVNADYYNRYGIGVKLNFMDRIDVPQDLIDNPDKVWYPKGPNNRITAYVINERYIRLPGATAYILRYTGTNARAMIVIGEFSQTSGTLAHEIGHAFSLDHVELHNNTMRPSVRARQYDVPNDFVEAQIDTVTSNLDIFKMGFAGKQREMFELIID